MKRELTATRPRCSSPWAHPSREFFLPFDCPEAVVRMKKVANGFTKGTVPRKQDAIPFLRPFPCGASSQQPVEERGMRLLTAIPVYNEERHLLDVLREVRRY